MRAKCAICEKIDQLDDESRLAKRLRNRPVHTYLCDTCYARIGERTEARLATGKFRLNEPKRSDDGWS